MFEETLTPETKALLTKLTKKDFPEGTYLAGGTALALQLGHRKSIDLDFFTPSDFDETKWEQKLSRERGFKPFQRDWQTIVGTISGARDINKKEVYLYEKTT